MGRRRVTKRRLQKYSIGDMRNRITLHTRALRPAGFGSASFSETYSAIDTVWAYVSTDTGQHRFNGVNIESGDQPTHLFVIRYRSDVTAETVIEFNGQYYEILPIIDPDERSLYLELPCKLAGSTGKSAAS